ncbi:MAG TPA: c-type cytochrome [Phycisphaerae bacterium]|nr:c-type cytochrome [Phycisphaerae bacterium]
MGAFAVLLLATPAFPEEPNEQDRGAVLYGKNCAICHGEQGDGRGKFAYLMNPRPRDFRQGNFKLATTLNQVPSDEDLLRTISRGMPGSAMPPWSHLPRADLEALVDYVRLFHVDTVRDEMASQVANGAISQAEAQMIIDERTKPGAALIIPSEPPFDEVRWFRGRRIYIEGCASCHGVDGHPVPEAVKYDSEGYPVPPRSFVNGIFKGGSEGHQLYARIVKGLKGTPMPAYEGSYSTEELWDLVHYVQTLARAGAQDRAQLKQATIVAANISATLPESPLDSVWDRARPAYVGLTPLWWTEDRIEGLVVQAMHNGEELAVRLSWIDPTGDQRAVGSHEFRDAVALQFSLTPDPPFYMGDPGEYGGVNIWMWKADKQHDLADGYQDVDSAYPDRVVDRYPGQKLAGNTIPTGEWPAAPISDHDSTFVTAWGAGNLVAQPNRKSSVESLVARGPGTLSGIPFNFQRVEGHAAYERGVWYVQMKRRMSFSDSSGSTEERTFRSGDYLPVSFATWNGSAGDRDGKKNISIWQKLVIE